MYLRMSFWLRCVRAKVIPAALVKGNFAPDSAISLKRLWPRETI